MSSRQLFFLYALTVPAFKVAMLPSYLAGEVGQDMWISIAFMMLIDIIILGIIMFIKTRVGLLTYDNGASKVLSRVIAVVCAIYFILQGIVYFEETVAYLIQSFFDEANRLQIIVPLAVAIGYIAYKGERTLGRIAEIVIWLLLLTILVSIAFNNAEIDFSNLLPIMDGGAKGVFGGYKSVVWFGDYLPLLFINLKDRRKRRYGYVFGGAGVILLMVVFINATFYSQWGELTSNVPNAFYRLSGYNFISADVGKIDWLVIITWITSCVTKLSLLLLGVRGAINHLFSKDVSKISTPVSAGIVGLCIVFFIKDVKTSYALATNLWMVGVVVTVLTVLILLVCAILSKRRIKDGQNI